MVYEQCFFVICGVLSIVNELVCRLTEAAVWGWRLTDSAPPDLTDTALLIRVGGARHDPAAALDGHAGSAGRASKCPRVIRAA